LRRGIPRRPGLNVEVWSNSHGDWLAATIAPDTEGPPVTGSLKVLYVSNTLGKWIHPNEIATHVRLHKVKFTDAVETLHIPSPYLYEEIYGVHPRSLGWNDDGELVVNLTPIVEVWRCSMQRWVFATIVMVVEGPNMPGAPTELPTGSIKVVYPCGMFKWIRPEDIAGCVRPVSEVGMQRPKAQQTLARSRRSRSAEPPRRMRVASSDVFPLPSTRGGGVPTLAHNSSNQWSSMELIP